MPLYDTTIFVAHIRRNARVRDLMEKMWDQSWPVHISAVTWYELHYGSLLSKDPATMTSLVNEYLQDIHSILPIDDQVSLRAAGIQATLRRSNQRLDLGDLFIAATALEHGLSICTLNTQHFARVPGLTLETF